MMLLLACSRPAHPPQNTEPAEVQTPTSIAERLGDWPFLTPIDAPPTVALNSGGSIPAGVDSCGACHPAHREEWSNSTHSRAIRDLQYLAELAKPGQPRWLCLNCHLPTQPQREHTITPETTFAVAGRIDSLIETPEPTFDPARIDEAIGCATCHVRRDSDGQGIVVGPRGSGRAPHRVRHDPSALEQICVSCHSPGEARISATFLCWFQTKDEIASGPMPDARCIDCHMPSVERPPAVSSAEPATVRRHLWQGGGVPKDFEGYRWLQQIGWEPALDIEVQRDPLLVILVNARAAHMLPTADPERHLRVEIRAEDASGDVLSRKTLRIGQRWDWGDEATGRTAHRLQDNRLLPGERRAWAPAIALNGAEYLVIEAISVRLTPENARYMANTTLDDELASLWTAARDKLPEIAEHYPLATIVHRQTVPLDGRAPVVATTAELLEESRAMRTLPLDVLAERLEIPQMR